MRKSILLMAYLFTAAALISCYGSVDVPPAGSYSKVVIVTEDGKPKGLAEDLSNQLQHPIDYYNRMELQFFTSVISARQFKKEPPSKNVVILGIPHRGEAGTLINAFIGPGGVQRVRSGQVNVLKKLHYPKKGQFSVILTAPTRVELKKAISEKGELIREVIEEANRQRIRDYLLRKNKEEVSEMLQAKYGFHVGVPSLYRLNQERPGIPGIEIVRLKPHRGLSVSWRGWEKERVSLADSSAYYQIRSEIAWELYDKDVMRRNLVSFRRDELGPYESIRMDGYWEDSQDTFGGPYVCFFVLDRKKSKLWIVDCLVYGPGFKKHKLLRELIAIAETFRF